MSWDDAARENVETEKEMGQGLSLGKPGHLRDRRRREDWKREIEKRTEK